MRYRLLAVAAVTVVAMVAAATGAAAVSHLEPDDEVPSLSFFFDPVLRTLYFDVGDAADCEAAPADCLAVEVREPVNHGAVVSSFVHALKENPELWDGPPGQLVRAVARSAAGKAPKPEQGDDEAEPTERIKPDKPGKGGPPPHAKAKGRRGG